MERIPATSVRFVPCLLKKRAIHLSGQRGASKEKRARSFLLVVTCLLFLLASDHESQLQALLSQGACASITSCYSSGEAAQNAGLPGKKELPKRAPNDGRPLDKMVRSAILYSTSEPELIFCPTSSPFQHHQLRSMALLETSHCDTRLSVAYHCRCNRARASNEQHCSGQPTTSGCYKSRDVAMIASREILLPMQRGRLTIRTTHGLFRSFCYTS